LWEKEASGGYCSQCVEPGGRPRWSRQGQKHPLAVVFLSRNAEIVILLTVVSAYSIFKLMVCNGATTGELKFSECHRLPRVLKIEHSE
jgi:hypothetical protein